MFPHPKFAIGISCQLQKKISQQIIEAKFKTNIKKENSLKHNQTPSR